MTDGPTTVSREEFEAHPGRYLDAVIEGGQTIVALGDGTPSHLLVSIASAEAAEPRDIAAFRSALREGVAELDRGERITLAEAKRELGL